MEQQLEFYGDYGKAIVYTDDIEQEAISQIVAMLNQPFSLNASVRIMPDVHAGSGCVIGYTAKLTDKVVPNLIGVDIGCGVTGWKLGKRSVVGEKFDKLDKIVREKVPSGKEVNADIINDITLAEIFNSLGVKGMKYSDWKKEVSAICKKVGVGEQRVWQSIGSLGGGNHFIEIDKDDNDELWLVIHSGSRNFGLKVAMYHQEEAERQTLTMPKAVYDKNKGIIEKRFEVSKKNGKGKQIAEAHKVYKTELESLNALAKVRKHKRDGLEYLEGDFAKAYYKDMDVAQIYAQMSRRAMGKIILKKMYKKNYYTPVESVHNYINFDDGIVRKGAISAHKDEEVLIPLNMAEGVVFGIGKGNDEWNQSAPHGAGRKMSRSKAKTTIALKDFQHKMKKAGVWSSCIGKSTIDEAPQAYKNADKVIEYLEETVNVVCRMKPVYNFKATDSGNPWDKK